MPFDIQGARNSGYSDDEIAQALAKRTGFDLDSATRAGYDTKSSIKAMIPRADQPNGAKPGFLSEAGGALKGAWEGTKDIAKRVAHDPFNAPNTIIGSVVDPQAAMAEHAAEAIGERDYPTAAMKAVGSAVPFLGPMSERAIDLGNQGNLPAALGSLTGNAALVGATQIPRAVRGAARGLGGALERAAPVKYQKALKPSPSARPQDVSRAVSTGLEEGIPVSGGGLARTKQLIANLETQKDAIIASDPTKTVSPGRVATYTRELESEFGNQAAPTQDLNSIANTVDDFYMADRPGGPIARPGVAARNLSAREAQDIKQGTYKRLGKRSYGEQKSAVVETEKQIARALNDDIVEAFPEMGGINTRQGSAIELKDFLEHRVRVEANKNPGGGLSTLAGGMGAVVEGMTGAVKGYGAAKAASVVNRVLRSQHVQSWIALKMHRASKGLLSLADAKLNVASRLKGMVSGDEPLGLSIKHVEGGDAPAASPVGTGPAHGVESGGMRPDGKPIVREVGTSFDPELFHGTAAKNIDVLSQKKSGYSKPETSTPFLPREMNEFGADLLLSEKNQAHQAVTFSSGKGEALAAVKIKHGTKVLDLSDEATRAPSMTLGGEPNTLKFFERPAITDDMIDWYLGRVTDRYKAHNPNWESDIRSRMDPSSEGFDVGSWRDSLVPYAKARGFGLVRFADETLVTDRSVIESTRRATPKEVVQAKQARRYPGLKSASMFTDQPTGTRSELDRMSPPEAPAMSPEDVPGIKVYHGSPHDFEKPDLSKIGTGEGAQAYGHGFYAAEAEDVARSYMKGAGPSVFRGRPIEGTLGALEQRMNKLPQDSPEFRKLNERYGVLEDVSIGKSAKDLALKFDTDEHLPETRSFVRGIKPEETAGKSLYEAEIPRAAAEKMLDWDKPLSEQSAHVRAALIKAGYDENSLAGQTGSELYHSMSSVREPIGDTGRAFSNSVSGQGAADALRDAGIPGIKYLDGMSRIPKDDMLAISRNGQQTPLETSAQRFAARVVMDLGEGSPAKALELMDTESYRPEVYDTLRQWVSDGSHISSVRNKPTSNYVLFDVDVLKDFKKRVEIQQRQAEVLRQHKAKKATGQ